MKIAYLDCYSGISGDMAIAAFLDAGLSFKKLSEELAKLKVKGYKLKYTKVKRGMLSGTKFDCIAEGAATSRRSVKDILSLIRKSGISGRAKEIAVDIFENIARAEKKIHGLHPSDKLHLHELADIDSIIDIAGLAIAIDEMGINEVYSSEVNMGRTFAKTAHGTIPIPGPASLELLKGAPVKISDIDAELVTPTGAGILKTLVKRYGDMPSMKVSAVGYGAGTRELKEIPNMLRLVIGEAAPSFKRDRIFVIETNIDDMSPQNFEYLYDKLFDEGALDVYTTAIQMKKSRPAFKLTVLTEPHKLEKMASLIFSETTTIGLRFYETGRFKLERKMMKANTKYGDVKVKVSVGPDSIRTASPEYDECVKLARKNRVPLKAVYEEAKRALVLSFLFLTFSFSLFAFRSFADTIYKTDGQELKGIVVEDYKDRLVFSTADGEITVMKSEIRDLRFDTEEDNLIKLAEQARERRNFTKAYAYYDMAYKMNPDSKAAKDGLVFLQGYMFRKEEVKKEDDIRRREEFERYGSVVPTEKGDEERLKESEEKLKASIGMTLTGKDGFTQIASVERDSPAYEAGIIKGDMLVAVWGRLTGYMELKEVLALLLDKPSLEIKCGIERAVDVEINPNRGALSGPNDLIGASFSMEFDGLTISGVAQSGYASAAGLKEGDLIISIDGNSTRYMPLKKAIELIRNSRENSVKLIIKKEVLIWRRSAR